MCDIRRRGCGCVRLGSEVCDHAAPPPPTLPGPELDVVLDRVVLAADGRARLVDSLETALREGGGRVAVEVVGGGPGAVPPEVPPGAGRARPRRAPPPRLPFHQPAHHLPGCPGF